MTQQMQASGEKKDKQIKELQDEIKILMAQKATTSTQSILAKNETEGKLEEMRQAHNAEKVKLENQLEDVKSELLNAKTEFEVESLKLNAALKTKEQQIHEAVEDVKRKNKEIEEMRVN